MPYSYSLSTGLKAASEDTGSLPTPWFIATAAGAVARERVALCNPIRFAGGFTASDSTSF